MFLLRSHFFVMSAHKKIDPNVKILLSYWSTFKFGLIFLRGDITRKETFKQAHVLSPNTKGQLISERNFGGFKSPKKGTKFLKDFCPSL